MQFSVDPTFLDDKFIGMKLKKKPRAYCSSQECAPIVRDGQAVYLKPKENAKKYDIWCPDCGFALFWK